MSTLSENIKNDLTFNAVYQAFTSKFNQFTYESSEDVLSIYEKDLLIGRIFFLKDISEVVRFIQLFIGRESDLTLFSTYFKKELNNLLTAAAKDIYEKAEIQMTTFEIYSLELSELALKTANAKKSETKIKNDKSGN